MLTMTENEKKKYFIKVSTDPMTNASSGLLAVAIASEAINQGHEVILFFAGDATKMLHKDVINNLHTVTFHGNGKAGEMAKAAIINVANGGGEIHVSEGSAMTYGITKENYKSYIFEDLEINWSYPKQVIELSSKSDLVFSY